MAFINSDGMRISYDCAELIEELNEDIAEFGKDTLMEVIVEEREGVTIYKDYWLYDTEMDKTMPKPKLNPGERYETMTAAKLMELYQIENSII